MKTGKSVMPKINGQNLKIAIVLPYFNDELGLELLASTEKELKKNRVQAKNISIVRTAGSLEISYACQKIAKKKNIDAIIALGVIIRGKTSHFDLVAKTTHEGLMRVQLDFGVPIIFGILACENLKQAKERVSEKTLNKGKDFAIAALIQSKI